MSARSASLLDALISEARDVPVSPGPDDDALVARAVLAGKARHAAMMRRRVVVAASCAFALAAMITLAWVGPHDVAYPVATAPVELVELTLPTGDRLTATADARCDVESSRESLRIVRMERGAILFDVAPLGAGSHFEVHTPDARVCVRGTVFAVEVSERGTAVWVYEGSVEVLRAGATAVALRAGDSYGAPSRRLHSLDARGRRASRARVLHPVAAVIETSVAMEPVHEALPATAPVRARRARAVHEPVVDASSEETQARDPLAEADTLRSLGRLSEAADAYEDAAHHLDGVSAHTASFLAAELRMRRLHDPAGALRVLNETGTDAVGSPLRERGLALRADALAQVGEREALREVARAYLDELPTGPHAAAMRRHLVEQALP